MDGHNMSHHSKSPVNSFLYTEGKCMEIWSVLTGVISSIVSYHKQVNNCNVWNKRNVKCHLPCY